MAMSKIQHGLPSELVDEVQSLIDEENIAIITKYGKIKAVLLSHNLVTKIMRKACEMMCHPANRGGLGLNPFNVHRNGRNIWRVGVDIGQLHGAATFQMSPDPSVRKEQVKFNKQLVDVAGGLLAPVNGSENSLTVSCGHWTALVRAIMHGCRTTEKEMADKDDILNRETFVKKDEAFFDLMDKGWSVTEFDWRCEAAWPALPDVAQRALNASNTVPSQSSEMEVAASTAEFADMARQKGSEPDFEACIQAATAGNPPCTPYRSVIRKLVEVFSGGAGSPMVHQTDTFAKRYAENKRLGEEFLSSIVDTVIHKTRSMARTRQACIMANLTSDKIVDGTAKLIVKADLTAIKNHTDVIAIENSFTAADQLLSELHAAGQWPDDVATVDVLGRYMVRSVCFMASKGKQSFERKTYEKHANIQDLLIDEIMSAVGRNHGGDSKDQILARMGWSADKPTDGDDASVAPAAAVVDTPTSIAHSFASLDEPTRLLANAGFQIDTVCFEKTIGKNSLYIFKELDAKNMVCVEERVMHGSPVRAKFSLVAFIERFSVFKGDLPMIMPDKFAAQTLQANKDYAIECGKAELFLALREFETNIAGPSYNGKLQYRVRPTQLRVTAPIKKGSLMMVPVVEHLHQLTTKSSASTIPSGYFVDLPDSTKVELFIPRASQPTTADPSKWRTGISALPFFWVTPTNKKHEANVIIVQETKHQKGFCVPHYVNIKPLAAFEILQVFEEKSAPKPLHGSSPYEKADTDQGDGTPATRPAKKAKRDT